MKILLATHFGVCFGVRDALDLALNLAREGEITILGELAHNPVIHHKLSAAGVRQGDLQAVGAVPTRRVLITAHGASDRAREDWKQAGYEVADATCPLVHHAHRQLRKLVQSGWHPVIIGQRGHVEVNGLAGDFPECSIVLDEADFAQLPAGCKYGVISQTTQPIAKVLALVEALRLRFPQTEVRFVDTVCRPTKQRQLAIAELIEKADRILVVGGNNSNNTRQLALAARQAGKPAHHITGPEEVEAGWFAHGETVGLTAGTSTLPETVEAVKQRLEKIAEELEP